MIIVENNRCYFINLKNILTVIHREILDMQTTSSLYNPYGSE